MQLFYCPAIETTPILSPDESTHCIKTLRHAAGDKILVTDGLGYVYECIIEVEHPRKCGVLILKKIPFPPARDYRLHIGIVPTKAGERTDWFIEKAVEFGIDEITFLISDHSERDKVNIDRMTKVAVAAMKQSLKATLPVFNGLIKLSEFLKQAEGINEGKWMMHCNYNYERKEINSIDLSGIKQHRVLIGPEGDFSEQEITLAHENNFTGISLGSSRLRTETAAVAVCSYLYLSASAQQKVSA